MTTQLGSIREGFGKGLKEAGQANPQVVALCADLTESIRMNLFAETFPERFVQVGVAEQNLIGVAAGIAMAGKVAFAGSYAVFSPGRSWDQIRVSVCYSNLNVKIVGGHAGITVGQDGATHQALEDIAMMRVLPNMTVVVPADEEEARQATLALAKIATPAYLRLARDKSANIFSAEDYHFALGKAVTLKQGADVSIFACGTMVAEALQASEKLGEEGIECEVINIHTIKPIDQDAILNSVKKTRAVVTAEEHQIAGGLASAIAEVLAQHQPTPMEFVGIKDTFGESGKPQELKEKYGMTATQIIRAVKDVLQRKVR